MNAEKIKVINDYLKEQLWMDFEICNMNGGKLEMFGFLDEAGEEKIRITFDRPYMVISTFFSLMKEMVILYHWLREMTR